MSPAVWAIAVLAGAFGQFIDALAGMGFGAFSGSILLAGGLSPVAVVGTVNLAKVGSGLASGLSHWRFGNVRWSWVTSLAMPGVIGGGVGALVLVRLPDGMARLWVPVVLAAMGAFILRSYLFRPALVAHARQESVALAAAVERDGEPSRLRLGGIGLVAGILNGVSGAFGPFATSSVLLYRRKQPRYAVGTVNLAELFVAVGTLAILLSRLEWATFRWELSLALMAGSVLAAPLGAYLARSLSARKLGATIGLVLVGVNSWNIWRALA